MQSAVGVLDPQATPPQPARGLGHQQLLPFAAEDAHPAQVPGEVAGLHEVGQHRLVEQVGVHVGAQMRCGEAVDELGRGRSGTPAGARGNMILLKVPT